MVGQLLSVWRLVLCAALVLAQAVSFFLAFRVARSQNSISSLVPFSLLYLTMKFFLFNHKPRKAFIL